MDWSDYSIHGRFEELISLFEASFSRLYASLTYNASDASSSGPISFQTNVSHVVLVPDSSYADKDGERKQSQFYVTLCDLCNSSSSSRVFNGISSRLSLLGCGSYSRDPLCALPTWFSEPRFLLIRSAMSIDDPVNGRIEIHESTSKRLLAAATIALSNVREQGMGRNSSCDFFDQIPIFVQVHSLNRRCFIGRKLSNDFVMEFATDGKHIRSRWSAEPPSHFGDGVCIGVPWHLSTLESVIRNFAGRIYNPKMEYHSSTSYSSMNGSLPLSTLASNLNLTASIALSYRVLPKKSSIPTLSNLPIVSTVEFEAAWVAPHTSFGSINRLPLSAEGATPSQLLAAKVLAIRVHWAENTSVTRTGALTHLNDETFITSDRISKSLVQNLLTNVEGLDSLENDSTSPANNKHHKSARTVKYVPLNVLLASTLRTSRQAQTDTTPVTAPVTACPIASRIAVLAFALECSYSLVSESRENEVEEIEWKRRMAAQARSRPPSASPGFVATSASLNSYASSDDDEDDLVDSTSIEPTTSSRRAVSTQEQVETGSKKSSRKYLKRSLTEAKAAAIHGEPVAFDLGADDLALLADTERKYSIDLMTMQSSVQSPSAPHLKTTSPTSSPNDTSMQIAATTSSSASSSTFSIARRLLKSVSSAQVLLGGAKAVAGLVHDPARFIALSDVHFAVRSAINAALSTTTSINDDADLLSRFSILVSRLCVNMLTACLPSVRLALARESNLKMAAHYNGESTSGITPVKSSSPAPLPPSPDMFGLSSRFPGGLIEWACAVDGGDDSETQQRMTIVRNLTLRTVCICWASLIKELRTHWVEARNGVERLSSDSPQFSSNEALNVLLHSIKTLISCKKTDRSNKSIESEALLRGDAALIILERMGIIAVTILLMNAASLLVVDQISETINRIQIGSNPQVINQNVGELLKSSSSRPVLLSNLFSSGFAALGGRSRGVAARLEELSESLLLDSLSCEKVRSLLDSGFSFDLSPKSSIRYEMMESSTSAVTPIKRVNASDSGVMSQATANTTPFGVSTAVVAVLDAIKASQAATRTATATLSDACCLLIATCADLETYIQRLQWLSSFFPESLTLALSNCPSIEYHREADSDDNSSTSSGVSRNAPFTESLHSLVDGRRIVYSKGDDLLNVLEGGGAARQGRYQDGTEHSLLIVAETEDEKKAVVAFLNASHPSDGGGVERLASDEVCFLLESSLPRFINSNARTTRVNNDNLLDSSCDVLHRALVRVDSIGARVSMQLSESL
jgi:hypothetical protein